MSPMRNCIVRFALALGFLVRRLIVGRVYSQIRRRKKKAMIERSPIAKSSGVLMSLPVASIYLGTATGMASCGTAGESTLCRPSSTIRATGRR